MLRAIFASMMPTPAIMAVMIWLPNTCTILVSVPVSPIISMMIEPPKMIEVYSRVFFPRLPVNASDSAWNETGATELKARLIPETKRNENVVGKTAKPRPIAIIPWGIPLRTTPSAAIISANQCMITS